MHYEELHTKLNYFGKYYFQPKVYNDLKVSDKNKTVFRKSVCNTLWLVQHKKNFIALQKYLLT